MIYLLKYITAQAVSHLLYLILLLRAVVAGMLAVQPASTDRSNLAIRSTVVRLQIDLNIFAVTMNAG